MDNANELKEALDFLSPSALTYDEWILVGMGLKEAGLPVEAWPSAANFVLVRTPHATRVRERLRDEHSILVRDFSYAPGLADCLRITVGTPQENDKVLATFAALVKEEM